MKTILGTMTFGDQVDAAGAKILLERFTAAGGDEIDTAHQYCEGRTETLLGDLLAGDLRKHLTVATKVNPWTDDGLSPESVRRQFDESLARLKVERVDLLYLHAPDLDTPVARTLEACHELHAAGRFGEFGLSNYAAWQVAEVVELCRRYGWMEPRVYQGMYNALTRDVERELFPCLRNYGLRFYAYNPLAGGLLTGKYRDLEALPDSGRFTEKTHYRERYWKREYFDVLRGLDDACRERGLTPTEVALGWLVNHSRLAAESGDGIILGVSKLEHLEANLAASRTPALDPALIEILDRGWEIIKPDCFRYFRP